MYEECILGFFLLWTNHCTHGIEINENFVMVKYVLWLSTIIITCSVYIVIVWCCYGDYCVRVLCCYLYLMYDDIVWMIAKLTFDNDYWRKMAPATRSNSGNERLPTTPEELETLVSGRIAQALAEHNATRTERSRDRTGSDRRETSPTGKKTSGIYNRSLRKTPTSYNMLLYYCRNGLTRTWLNV